MFKRVFGSEECKDILITFLNRIVGNGDIEDVTFQNTEHLGPTADDRRAVFDIAVRTKSEDEYIIEMQLAQQEQRRFVPQETLAKYLIKFRQFLKVSSGEVKKRRCIAHYDTPSSLETV